MVDATNSRTRWQNAFIYSLLTTIMVYTTLFALQAFGDQSAQQLADRVDRNAAVAVTGTDAIICILQLGVDPAAPPRTKLNVDRCLKQSGYIDIPTVQPPPTEVSP